MISGNLILRLASTMSSLVLWSVAAVAFLRCVKHDKVDIVEALYLEPGFDDGYL